MSISAPSVVAHLDPRTLKPYSSFLVLEYTGSDPARAVPKMLEVLRTKALRPYGSRTTEILAVGFENPGELLAASRQDVGVDVEPSAPAFEALDGFAYRSMTPPGWATKDSRYLDVSNELAVVHQRRSLIAVYTHSSLRRTILNWVRGKDLPPFRCVRPAVFHAAFLVGDAKNLSLQGVHPRTATKADAKSISGQRLQEALNGFEDSTFSLRSGRAAVPDDDGTAALRGTVGTTPRDALVWNRVSSDFADFLMTAYEVFERVHLVMVTNAGIDQPFPQLATTVDSLDGLHGAFEVMVHDPVDLPPDADPDAVAAADFLQGRIVDIVGNPNSAKFTVHVGEHGAVAGELDGIVHMDDDGTARLEFGYARPPTHEGQVRPVLAALNRYPELLAVYYASGHLLANHCVSQPQTQPAVFPRWEFEDFGIYDIGAEKPIGKKTASEIHAAIGDPGDRSLFGWVAQRYEAGWLACDDGPDEIADFIHLDNDRTLSLIHVKAADSTSTGRRVAVGPYHVVTSQATKNVRFLLDNEVLADRLSKSMLSTPATWCDGVRVDDRSELVDLVRCRSSRDRTQVVIVQPHVSESTINRARQDLDDGDMTPDVLRLQLLETLLNSARAAVVGLAADLTVISSMA